MSRDFLTLIIKKNEIRNLEWWIMSNIEKRNARQNYELKNVSVAGLEKKILNFILELSVV